MKMRPSPLKMFASPWTAPAWMKSNNNLIGEGYLLPEYYQAWANYFVKFLKSYEAEGVPFWGLTAQNEPVDGKIPDFTFNCMGWNSTTQREWIVNNLGPTLEKEGFSDIKLMILDDQRPLAPKWAREVFADERAMNDSLQKNLCPHGSGQSNMHHNLHKNLCPHRADERYT